MLNWQKIAFWKRPWWKPFWDEVNTPETGDTAYDRGRLYLSHMALGALVAYLITLPLSYIVAGWIAYAVSACAIAIIYGRKELNDIWAGGTRRDSNEDILGVMTAVIGVGSLSVAPWQFCAGVHLISAAYIVYVLIRQLKREAQA